MKPLGWVKPEYVFRPAQLLRRVGWLVAPPRDGYLTRRLPWGLDIRVRSDEVHGEAILHLGVIDLVVTEALWRLCDEGETCLDIGANIGYMTSVLASRTGRRGRVVSFEAHPEICRELQRNISAWREAIPGVTLNVHGVALSNTRGSIPLEVPPEFARNRGVCRVPDRSARPPAAGACLTVPCNTLGDYLTAGERVGVAKMDVEGHEEAVLLGARDLLAAGAVRDWVFEHHGDYPSRVTDLFEQNGYTVLRLQKGFFGPAVRRASDRVNAPTWVPPSFLATRSPGRVAERFRPAGWHALRGR
jgi:FkbM family methyltransferase